jgi:pimeloyl-ACP methyl ester carboxylesterase
MDFRLRYIEMGSGVPLLLLHGNGESHTYFARQTEPLSLFFRVIAVDTRGHGDSPRGGAPFTLEQFAQDLMGFMDSLNLARAHILGFSDGGNIALLFALRHPERVCSLILNGANLHPRGIRAELRLRDALAYGPAALLSPFSRRAKAKKERLGLMVREPHIRKETLNTLRMPVLVIAGDHDMIYGSHTRAIAEAIPGAELCILPGDHFIAARNSEAFNRRV